MTGASEELLQAVYGLRRAAEGQFTGNAYYQVTNEINGLIELLGAGSGNVPAGKDAVYGFATMLAEVRKLAEGSSQYQTIAARLDVMASHLASGASAPAPAKAAAPAEAPAPAATATPEAPASVPVSPPEGLLEAVYGLRRAAEAQFSGNTYYQVSNEINGLSELLGLQSGSVPVGKAASYGFATMLDEIRKAAQACTSPERSSAVAHKLDVLASYIAPAAPAAEEPATAPEPAVAAAPEPVAAPAAAAAPSEAAFAEEAPPCAFKAKFAETAEILTAEPAPAEMPTDHADLAAAHVAVHGSTGGACPFPPAAADTAGAAAGHAAPAAEPAAPPLSALAGREKIESFDELAAASKARVEQAAASLGVAPAHPSAPSQPESEAERAPVAVAAAEVQPVPVAEAVVASEPAPAMAEAADERRLERRSSGDAISAVEPMEPAGVPAEAAPEPVAQEATPDLGSPPVESEVIVAEKRAAVEAAAVEPAVEPAAAAASAPAPETAAAAAPAEKIEVAEAGPKRKEPKSLFKLWLDLAFGRKD